MSPNQKMGNKNYCSTFNVFKMVHWTFLTQKFFPIIKIFHIVCNSTKNRKLMLIKKLFTFWKKKISHTLPSMMSYSSQIFRVLRALHMELERGGFLKFFPCKWWHVLWQVFTTHSCNTTQCLRFLAVVMQFPDILGGCLCSKYKIFGVFSLSKTGKFWRTL